MTQFALYTAVPFDRGARARWLAYELGIAVEDHKVNMAEKEHKSEAFRKINPFGQVPAAMIDGMPVFDSSAICLRLLEAHPDSGLAPKIGSPERSAFLSWYMYGVSTLDKGVFDLFWFKRTPENAAPRAQAFERLKPTLDILSEHLQSRPYVLGADFSAADIVIGYGLMLLRRDEVLSPFTILNDYLKRLEARPAAQRAGLFNT